MLAAHRDRLLSLPGVVGIGRGEQDGQPCVLVFVEYPAGLPAELEGYPVSAAESGPVDAFTREAPSLG